MLFRSDLIAKAAQLASAKGAKLLLTPELSLTGYPPEDLLLRDAFIQAVDQQLALLTKTLAAYPDLRVIVGHPKRTVAGLQNMASVLYRGEIIASYAKQKLPNHEVFDEVRYFVPGADPCIFEIDGTKVGLIICEDAWHASAAAQAKHHGAELLVFLMPHHIIWKSNLCAKM